ncbi:hypothetical protein YC2023_084405 [Brassica napus]
MVVAIGYGDIDRQSQRPRYQDPRTRKEWRPVQRATAPESDRVSEREPDHTSDRGDTAETEEEKRRKLKGKAHVVYDAESPRPLLVRTLAGPLVIREREEDSENEQIEAIAQLGRKEVRAQVSDAEARERAEARQRSEPQNQSIPTKEVKSTQTFQKGILKLKAKIGVKKAIFVVYLKLIGASHHVFIFYLRFA